MSDLLADLYAEIDRRETVAKAAISLGDEATWVVLYGDRVVARVGRAPTWYGIASDVHTEHAEHMADNDPATSLRFLALMRRILGRHVSTTADNECDHCVEPMPCPDIRDVAEALGIGVPS